MNTDGQAQQDKLTGVSIALTAVSVIIVALRIYTRAFIVRNVGADDYTMVSAVVFTLGYLATLLALRSQGMGFSGTVLSLSQMVNTLKGTVSIEIFYYLCVNAIKLSIVFFYLRIAVEKRFERICKGTIYFLTTFCVVCIVVVFVQCLPLHKLWDLTGTVQGKCINSTAFFYMTSATNIALDIWIIVLPVKVLLSVQRPTREKIALVTIFALGTFSCIASIVRLYTIRVFTESKDPFYDIVPINLWSMVEINIGIWCASIPALKALFSTAQRQRTLNSNQGRSGLGGAAGTAGGRTGYQFHSSGRSGGGSKGGTQLDHNAGGKGGFGTTSSTNSSSLGHIVKNEEFVLSEYEEGKVGVALSDGRHKGGDMEHGMNTAWRDGSQERIVSPHARV